MLESYLHADNVFVTLTYAEAPPELKPADLRNFMKRLRKLVPSVRYFACGEYGSEKGRPHYHLILFGLSWLHKSTIEKAWSLKDKPIGRVNIGTVTPHSAGYVTGYLGKGWTFKECKKLDGRHPEFARMSKKPGLGADALKEIERALSTEVGAAGVQARGDVPCVFRVAGKEYPMGTYLVRKLRELYGWKANQPDQIAKALRNARLAEPVEVTRKRDARRVAHYHRALGIVELKSTMRKL